jgi:hypothetical protein
MSGRLVAATAENNFKFHQVGDHAAPLAVHASGLLPALQEGLQQKSYAEFYNVMRRQLVTLQALLKG